MSAVMTPDFQQTITTDDVNVTQAAMEKLAELLKEVDDGQVKGVRIFVNGGGCGGMSYGMTFTTETSDYDHMLEHELMNLYVDAVAMNFLRGVEIDFVEREMGASFVFNNVFKSIGGSGGCSACGASGGGCA